MCRPPLTHLLAAGLLLSSCVKEEYRFSRLEYNLQPALGIPIAQAHLQAASSIAHFNNTGYLSEDASGALTLVYPGNTLTYGIGQVLQLPDQQFTQQVDLLPAELLALQSQDSVSIERSVIYELQGLSQDRLDSLRIAGGQLSVHISADGFMPVSGKASLVSADQSEFAQLAFDDQSAPTDINVAQSLTGKLLLPINNAETQNGIRIQLEITAYSSSTSTASSLTFHLAFTELKPAAAGGFLTPRTLQAFRQQSEIDLFSHPFSAQISVEDPRLVFEVENGFGLEAAIYPDSVRAIAPDGAALLITGEHIEALPLIAAAPAPGSPALSSLSIDNSMITPGVTDLLAFGPQYISSQVNLGLNPQGAATFFLRAEDELKVHFRTEVPIFGAVTDFLLRDTTPAHLGEVLDALEAEERIDSAELRLAITTSLPLEASLQVLFADSSHSPIDSLFTESVPLLPSATMAEAIDELGRPYARAAGENNSLHLVHISRQRLQKLETCTYIHIRVKGHTAGGSGLPIKLYATDGIAATLAAVLKLEL